MWNQRAFLKTLGNKAEGQRAGSRTRIEIINWKGSIRRLNAYLL